MFFKVPKRQLLQRISLLVAVTLLSACSNLSTLLFYPDKTYYRTPEQLNIAFQTITLTTRDGSQLRSWLLSPKEPPTATILFLHGNGENISTHMGSIAWATHHGYEVFMLDYRGYGKSTGVPTLENVFEDIALAHEWVSTYRNAPLILLGQSMGGALAITYGAHIQQANQDTESPLRAFDALVSESAPASWPQVAREALSKHWATWLLQGPASLLPSDYDAKDAIGKLTDVPLLLIHSRDDQVVDFQHFETLQAHSPANTQTIVTKGQHIAAFSSEENRNSLLRFIQTHIQKG